MKTLFVLIACTLTAAADPATDLAAHFNALQQDGTSFIRLRMEYQQTTLQVQIKQRRTQSTTEVIYQVLWPKERAGEGVLLRKTANQAASGAVFVPPDTIRPLTSAQMKEPLFGSSLCYADVLENFFAWQHQAIVGNEVLDRATCVILESKPGKGDRSVYASVRTWVDSRRIVPLRVEKYAASGKMVRRIETTRVVSNNGHAIPANLTVSDPQKNSTTDLDGSNIKRSVTYDDATFTAEGLKILAPPSTK